MVDNLVADPSKGRSPCFTCPIHLDGENKRGHSECERCEKRIQYVREHCHPRTIDEIIRLQERIKKQGSAKKVFQGAEEEDAIHR